MFLFSKRPRYFYDAEALRGEHTTWAEVNGAMVNTKGGQGNAKDRGAVGRPNINDLSGNMAPGKTITVNPAGKNARTVWTIPTEPNALAICRICDAYWQGGAPREHCGEPVVQHFAAFPRELVRRMILAGTSERGVCGECGAPWVREVETEIQDVPGGAKRASDTNIRKGHAGEGRVNHRASLSVTTLGWRPSCVTHDIEHMLNAAPPIPATVLDPFSGSGTTLLVARSLGRHSVGIELNERYAAMSSARLSQLSLLSELA